MLPLKFIEKIHNYEITLDKAIDNQEKLEKLIIRLENYGTKSSKKKDRKIKSAIKLFDARENTIDYFKKGIFPFKGNVFKTKEEKSEEIKEETKEEFINNTLNFIEKKSKDVNNDLFETYFNF